MNEETEATGDNVTGKVRPLASQTSLPPNPICHCTTTISDPPQLNPFCSWFRFDTWCVHWVSERGQTQSGAFAESALVPSFQCYFLPLLSLVNFRQTSSPLLPAVHPQAFLPLRDCSRSCHFLDSLSPCLYIAEIPFRAHFKWLLFHEDFSDPQSLK